MAYLSLSRCCHLCCKEVAHEQTSWILGSGIAMFLFVWDSMASRVLSKYVKAIKSMPTAVLWFCSSIKSALRISDKISKWALGIYPDCRASRTTSVISLSVSMFHSSFAKSVGLNDCMEAATEADLVICAGDVENSIGAARLQSLCLGRSLIGFAHRVWRHGSLGALHRHQSLHDGRGTRYWTKNAVWCQGRRTVLS